MKKFVVIIVIFLVVINAKNNQVDFSLLNYFSGNYTAYSSTDKNGNSLNLGFCYMSQVPVPKDMVGESMEIENLEVGSALKTLKAKVVKTEFLDDGTTVIYAFTNLIKDKVKVGGQNVNLQIAEKENTFIIGWPLILGAY